MCCIEYILANITFLGVLHWMAATIKLHPICETSYIEGWLYFQFFSVRRVTLSHEASGGRTGVPILWSNQRWSKILTDRQTQNIPTQKYRLHETICDCFFSKSDLGKISNFCGDFYLVVEMIFFSFSATSFLGLTLASKWLFQNDKIIWIC